MTKTQLQAKIDAAKFTYIGKGEELYLKSLLTGLNEKVPGIWSGIGSAFTSYAKGDLIYASATNTLSKLAVDTDGYVLTLASGLPVWAAASGGSSLPSMTGQSGKYLTTDGSVASWGNGAVNTSADWIWTGKHTFNNAVSGLTTAFDITSSLTATTNNQSLISTYINPTFTVGSFTGIKRYGLYVNQGGIYSNGNPTGVSYWLANGNAIRVVGSGSTNFYIDGNESLGGTIWLRSSTVNIGGTVQVSNLTNTGNFTTSGSNVVSLITGPGVPSLRLTSTSSSSTWYLENNRFSGGGFSITNNVASPLFDIATSGSIGIHNSSPNSSALVDMVSTTKGFLPPRMTTTQWGMISSKAEGLQAWDNVAHGQIWFDGTGDVGFRYNRGTSKFQGYDGASWIDLN